MPHFLSQPSQNDATNFLGISGSVEKDVFGPDIDMTCVRLGRSAVASWYDGMLSCRQSPDIIDNSRWDQFRAKTGLCHLDPTKIV